MHLVEKIETINSQLKDQFGSEFDGSPIWRVVFSEDQFEKRLTEYTDSGIKLLHPEVRELPKYRQWIKKKYVLERLCVIPEVSAPELPANKLSYEPIYVFQDNSDNYLPPKYAVAKFVIDTVYAAQGKKSMRKYIDEEAQNPVEHRHNRIKQLELDLFGNETPVTDALAYGMGVATPHKHFGEK